MEKQKTNKKGMVIILIGILIIIIGTGLYFWIKSRNIISTENAQLDCNIVSVRSSLGGYIKSVNFSDNQSVKKGDTLFILDTTEWAIKLQQATTALQIAMKRYGSAKQKIIVSQLSAAASDVSSQSLQQNVASAKANLSKAQENLNRVNNLLKIKAATQEQYEAAINTASVAKAEYEKAIQQQKSAAITAQSNASMALYDNSQSAVAGSELQQYALDVKLAKETLSHAYIIAPCDGIVSKRTVESGQYIAAGQTLCAVVNNTNMWVTANFKETELNDLRKGQKVKIKIDAYSGLILKGIVESFSGATGAKYSLIPADNATGNFIKITQRIPVKIILTSLPPRNIQLFPGCSVFVKINPNE